MKKNPDERNIRKTAVGLIGMLVMCIEEQKCEKFRHEMAVPATNKR